MYRKGIDVLRKDIEGLKAAGMQEDLKLTQKQIASAFASIAELYMGDHLW